MDARITGHAADGHAGFCGDGADLLGQGRTGVRRDDEDGAVVLHVPEDADVSLFAREEDGPMVSVALALEVVVSGKERRGFSDGHDERLEALHVFLSDLGVVEVERSHHDMQERGFEAEGVRSVHLSLGIDQGGTNTKAALGLTTVSLDGRDVAFIGLIELDEMGSFGFRERSFVLFCDELEGALLAFFFSLFGFLDLLLFLAHLQDHFIL